MYRTPPGTKIFREPLQSVPNALVPNALSRKRSAEATREDEEQPAAQQEKSVRFRCRRGSKLHVVNLCKTIPRQRHDNRIKPAIYESEIIIAR